MWSDSALLVPGNPWRFLVFSALQGRRGKDDALLVFCLSLSCCLVLFKKQMQGPGSSQARAGLHAQLCSCSKACKIITSAMLIQTSANLTQTKSS